jgi:hypothetical protein
VATCHGDASCVGRHFLSGAAGGAAGGVIGGSGFLAAVGRGALFGGGAEAAAQALNGKLNPLRFGAAAGMGGATGGALHGLGAIVGPALRSAGGRLSAYFAEGPGSRVVAGIRAVFSGREGGPAFGGASAAETEASALNSAGRAYPEVLHPGTGEPIPYPGEGLTKVPVSERVPWGAQERGSFIKEWYDRGFSTPEGGWSEYDIHHVIPREYGGTNDFGNLVPVERGVHQSEFNTWWRGY